MPFTDHLPGRSSLLEPCFGFSSRRASLGLDLYRVAFGNALFYLLVDRFNLLAILLNVLEVQGDLFLAEAKDLPNLFGRATGLQIIENVVNRYHSFSPFHDLRLWV